MTQGNQKGSFKELKSKTFSGISGEGLMLKTSASESLYGGQFTLSTQLIKPNYLVILPLTQHHSFFRNLPPLFDLNLVRLGSVDYAGSTGSC